MYFPSYWALLYLIYQLDIDQTDKSCSVLYVICNSKSNYVEIFPHILLREKLFIDTSKIATGKLEFTDVIVASEACI